MSEPLKAAVTDALDAMMSVADPRVAPAETRRCLGAAAGRHGVRCEVLSEREPYSGRTHFDVLLRAPGAGAVSLGFAPDEGVPWVMRGAFRWSEVEILRVNDTRLDVQWVLQYLDSVWNDAGVHLRLINSALVQEFVETEGRESFDVSAEDLQDELDGFRQNHGLYTVEQTQRWMAERGITHEMLEHVARDRAVVAKVRERVVAGRERAYFDAHGAAFDAVDVARIVVPDADAAAALFERLAAREVDFWQAAEGEFFGHPEARTGDARTPGVFARLYRGEVEAPLRAVVFAAAPGAVLPPQKTRAGYEIVRVLAHRPAEFDADTKRSVHIRLFNEWLRERRQAAEIEWSWGPKAADSAPLDARAF